MSVSLQTTHSNKYTKRPKLELKVQITVASHNAIYQDLTGNQNVSWAHLALAQTKYSYKLKYQSDLEVQECSLRNEIGPWKAYQSLHSTK